MKTATVWRAGSATDAGLERTINEDRVFVDEGRGLFMVVDGLGGHAAGETAAETAVDVIEKELRTARTVDEASIRHAITAANNAIYELAEKTPAYRGMACVLTLAVAAGDQFLIGHVGDSRLYQFWNGRLQKMTMDHSPVGELEDAGELTEEQAMRHPRRNEVFRDVGSYPHMPDDPRFIEISHFTFRPDAALLLCSDGLTDLVKASEIGRIVERYDGDARKIAQLLVDAANAAGGRDNISVVFVAGPDFLGAESAALSEGRSRHGTTRMRGGKKNSRSFFRSFLLLLTGVMLGLSGWYGYQHYLTKPAAPLVTTPAPHIAQDIQVDSTNTQGIVNALAQAHAGDTILVPAGEYVGPLVLKERVNIVGQAPHHVIVRADATAPNNAGLAVLAQGVKEARIKGLHLEGDEAHPLRTGLQITDSSIEAEDIEVSGAQECGVRIQGDSHPLIMASNIHGNAGPGVVVQGSSAPRLLENRITDNGRVAGSPHAGIEIGNEAQPSLLHNEILHNGLAAVFPLALDEEIRAKNTVDAATAAKPPARPHPVAPATKPKKLEVKPNAIGHPTKPLTEA